MYDIETKIVNAIVHVLPKAKVYVEANGGHFKIKVISKNFEGKKTLEKQQIVLSSIKKLMAGPNPPVHAIDKLETLINE